MKNEDHVALGADALALLRAAGAADGPPPDAKLRVRLALTAALAAGAATAATAGATTAAASATAGATSTAGGSALGVGAATGTASVGLATASGAGAAVGTGTAVGGIAAASVFTKAAVLAVALGAVGSAALVGTGAMRTERAPAPHTVAAALAETTGAMPARDERDSAEPPSTSDEPVPAAAEAAAPLEPAGPLETAEIPSLAPRGGRVRAPVALPVAAPPASAGPAATLAEEIPILRAGRRALAAGDAEGALAHVADHASRYPEGAMAEERDRLRVEALCRLGHTTEANDAREAFLREHPRSPHAAAVRALCAE